MTTAAAPWVNRSRPAEASRGSPNNSGHSSGGRLLVSRMLRRSALCRPLLFCVDGCQSYLGAIRRVFREPIPTGGRPRLRPWDGIYIAQVEAVRPEASRRGEATNCPGNPGADRLAARPNPRWWSDQHSLHRALERDVSVASLPSCSPRTGFGTLEDVVARSDVFGWHGLQFL
jgi:hypothetical protein